MTTTTRNRYKSDSTSKDTIFKLFKKENPESSLTKKQYFDIVKAVHTKIFEVICEREYAVRISHTVGSFYLKAFTPREKKHRVVDLKKSQEYDSIIYFKNSHTDGKRFKFLRSYSKVSFSLNTIFKFKMCRKNNRALAQRLFKKEIPTWT